MTPESFAYWLKGFIEISEPKTLNEKQTQIIKDHLNLVFDKVTPTYESNPDIEKEEKEEKVSNRQKINFQDILDKCEHEKIKIFPKFKPSLFPRRNNRNSDSNRLLC